MARGDAFRLRPLLARAFEFPDGFRIARHDHGGGQLEYASAGVMTVVTDDGAWVVPPQRAVWLPPLTPHEVRMRGAVSMRTVYVSPGLSRRMPRSCCVVAVTPLLSELILAAVAMDEPYPLGGAEERLFRVLLDRVRVAHVAPLHLPLRAEGPLRELTLAMQRDPSDARGLDAWAHDAGMSGRTVARLFRSGTGMTFGGWRQQMRLLEAMRLLASGVGVTETALACGYDSTSAFIGMFRRATGRSPGRYFAADSG